MPEQSQKQGYIPSTPFLQVAEQLLEIDKRQNERQRMAMEDQRQNMALAMHIDQQGGVPIINNGQVTGFRPRTATENEARMLSSQGITQTPGQPAGPQFPPELVAQQQQLRQGMPGIQALRGMGMLPPGVAEGMGALAGAQPRPAVPPGFQQFGHAVQPVMTPHGLKFMSQEEAAHEKALRQAQLEDIAAQAEARKAGAAAWPGRLKAMEDRVQVLREQIEAKKEAEAGKAGRAEKGMSLREEAQVEKELKDAMAAKAGLDPIRLYEGNPSAQNPLIEQHRLADERIKKLEDELETVKKNRKTPATTPSAAPATEPEQPPPASPTQRKPITPAEAAAALARRKAAKGK